MNEKGFGDIVAAMGEDELDREITRPDRLLIGRGRAGTRPFQIAWAPFAHVNREARLAIIGITPGREQMGTSLRRYRRARQDGLSHSEADALGKATGSFSGGMRDTLIRCLDEIGVNRHLGIASSGSLWGADGGLVHFSSALRWPVFVEGRGKDAGKMVNYTGSSPKALKVPEFRKIIEKVLVPELRRLPAGCLIAPLGDAANTMVMHALSLIPGFDQSRYLPWLPHPSGGNRNISSQFLGDPPRPTRTKPLNQLYRQQALALRAQVAAARPPIEEEAGPDVC